MARSVAELQAFTAGLPFLAALPRGDGHPVLVLPGFTGDDRSTATLRWFLNHRNYRATPWRLGRNLGPTDHILDGMAALLDRFAEVTEVRVKVEKPEPAGLDAAAEAVELTIARSAGAR